MNKIYKKISLEPFKSRFDNKSAYENILSEPNVTYNEETDEIIVMNVDEISGWGKLPMDIIVNNYIRLTEISENIPLVKYESGGTNYFVLRYYNMVKLYVWLKDFIKNSIFYRYCKRGWVKINNRDFFATGVTNILTDLDDAEISDNAVILINEESDKFKSIFVSSADTNYDSAIARSEDIINVFETTFIKGENFSGISQYINIPIMITEQIKDLGLNSPSVDYWIPNKIYHKGEYVLFAEKNIYQVYKLKEQYETYKGNFIQNSSFTITYFDDIDTSGNLVFNHWELVKDAEVNSETNSSTTFIGESKLMSLKRSKKSYDDKGNELPFIVNISGGTELQFLSGIPFNTTIDSDGYYSYDYISAITYTGDTIEFTYYKGASDLSGDTGIKYNEWYPYTTKEWTGIYDGNTAKTFTYTAITFSNQIPSEKNDGKLYSRITISDSQRQKDDFLKINYFKDESMLGIQDYKTDSSNYKIERGKSAAFEKHNALSECSSLDDIETYRGNFFKINDDEND